MSYKMQVQLRFDNLKPVVYVCVIGFLKHYLLLYFIKRKKGIVEFAVAFIFRIKKFLIQFYFQTEFSYSPTWPGTCYLDQTGLDLTEVCQPLPPELLELKVSVTTLKLFYKDLKKFTKETFIFCLGILQ